MVIKSISEIGNVFCTLDGHYITELQITEESKKVDKEWFNKFT